MPHPEQTSFSGKVTHVFAHRAVLQGDGGEMLVDFTPEGAKAAKVQLGDEMTVWGDLKPSELKVERFARNGEDARQLKHEPKPAPAPSGTDLATAINAAIANGYEVVGTPRHRPKHVEILGRHTSGEVMELHVDQEGRLAKTKAADMEKWAGDLRVD